MLSQHADAPVRLPRRLSAGDSDGNSRGSGGRKRPGGPDSGGGGGQPVRGSKAARSGSGGEAAAGANVVMASQMDCSQRVRAHVCCAGGASGPPSQPTALPWWSHISAIGAGHLQA